MKERLFVYGTLMERHIRAAVELVGENELQFVGEGVIEGELYDLGEYPGAVQKKGKRVYGELYEIIDSEDVLRKLDDYEEFDPSNPKGSLFVRRKAEVVLENGKKLVATVYFYNGSTRGFRIISSGKWKKSANKRT